jgi:hypothetical protein
MKYASLILTMLLLFTAGVSAQGLGQTEDEPTANELGAPLYPGADFIRKSVGLNPAYETAVYITLVPMEMVEAFFSKKLVEKRVIYYSDEDMYLTAFLLKTWSRFPTNPDKDELAELENEPTVQVMYYDPNAYEPLAEFFDRTPEGKVKASTIRNGETMIRFTYPRMEGVKSSKRIIASWKETSRDLPEHYGSTLAFNSDGTYIYTLTPENIEEMAKNKSLKAIFGAENEDALKKHLEGLNPETGEYAIMRNSISMASDNPIDGQRIKSGLADAGTAMLSLILINKPRLTFLKQRAE